MVVKDGDLVAVRRWVAIKSLQHRDHNPYCPHRYSALVAFLSGEFQGVSLLVR